LSTTLVKGVWSNSFQNLECIGWVTSSERGG
jgi:hypothetical protein